MPAASASVPLSSETTPPAILASKFQTNDSDSALAYMGRLTMKTMAIGEHSRRRRAMFQAGVICPHGRGWRKRRLRNLGFSMFMVRDEISWPQDPGRLDSPSACWLVSSILRTDGFDRLKFKVA